MFYFCLTRARTGLPSRARAAGRRPTAWPPRAAGRLAVFDGRLDAAARTPRAATRRDRLQELDHDRARIARSDCGAARYRPELSARGTHGRPRPRRGRRSRACNRARRPGARRVPSGKIRICRPCAAALGVGQHGLQGNGGAIAADEDVLELDAEPAVERDAFQFVLQHDRRIAEQRDQRERVPGRLMLGDDEAGALGQRSRPRTSSSCRRSSPAARRKCARAAPGRPWPRCAAPRRTARCPATGTAAVTT